MTPAHIYVTGSQPATRWVDPYDGRTCGFSPRRQIRCTACGQRRWAQYMVTQVYYDQQPFFCAPGRGCKRFDR